MVSQGSRDTAPELAVRRELHRRGYRYRVHQRAVPELRRTLDVVFTAAKVAVDIRGCFWHACPHHGRTPTANEQWWRVKLARTAQRDRETVEALEQRGWTVVVVWEHEDAVLSADRVARAIRERVGVAASTRQTLGPANTSGPYVG